ncbi:MAG: inorganic phosphate transporter [Lactobacillales bacterium]|jgi:PiT family inorganic phosphate transporter|nr:inorganic phosphate transporter [Lactobacillales bacterium]
MNLEIIVAVLVIVFALAFDFTNGFHDAANAIASAVSTRALSPRVALTLAAVMNLIGAMLGTAVASTIAKEIVELSHIAPMDQLTIVLAALIGAITWNLLTWWFGLPSSSSHAIIGGLVGAGLSAMLFSGDLFVKWDSVWHKVVEPMFLSPLVGFLGAYIVMIIIQWIFRRANPTKAYKGFRVAQIFSSAALALGHGLQDAQKSMGIIFMACAASGLLGVDGSTDHIPLAIMLMCALAIGAGTFVGGKRIMKTLGSKIIDIDPAKGFSAELVSATVLYVTAYFVKAPISTTHTVTSSILGAGAANKAKAVNWMVARNIVGGWFITMPMAAVIAFVLHEILRLFL